MRRDACVCSLEMMDNKKPKKSTDFQTCQKFETTVENPI